MLIIATQLFAELGFKAVSVRQIAHKCGLTLSSLYHHFGNKRSLYIQAHLKEFEKSSARLEAAIANGETAEQRLGSFTIELCRIFSEPGPLFKLLARHWLEGDPDVVRDLAQATVPAQFRQVRATIGAITPGRNPTATALSIYALVHGLVTLRQFEDSLPWNSGISRQPEATAGFVLESLIPEIDWKAALRLPRGRNAKVHAVPLTKIV
jgi:TetR/AcrR family transcriptional regulator